MSMIINYVVDTYSEKERDELAEFVCGNTMAISAIKEGDGYQKVAVIDNGFWFLSSIFKTDFSDLIIEKQCSSLEEFKKVFKYGK